MNKQTYIIIGIVVVVVIVGLVFFGYSGSNAPAGPTGTPPTGTPVAQNPAVPTGTIATTTPAPGTQYIVTYTDSGFSPSTLTVPKGTTVIFKNSASDGVRVASNPHPIHNGYPTTGGCIASTFDACQIVPPGQSWAFKFDIVGKWGYHNHLNPTEGGTIVVQ